MSKAVVAIGTAVMATMLEGMNHVAEKVNERNSKDVTGEQLMGWFEESYGGKVVAKKAPSPKKPSSANGETKEKTAEATTCTYKAPRKKNACGKASTTEVDGKPFCDECAKVAQEAVPSDGAAKKPAAPKKPVAKGGKALPFTAVGKADDAKDVDDASGDESEKPKSTEKKDEAEKEEKTAEPKKAKAAESKPAAKKEAGEDKVAEKKETAPEKKEKVAEKKEKVAEKKDTVAEKKDKVAEKKEDVEDGEKKETSKKASEADSKRAETSKSLVDKLKAKKVAATQPTADIDALISEAPDAAPAKPAAKSAAKPAAKPAAVKAPTKPAAKAAAKPPAKKQEESESDDE